MENKAKLRLGCYAGISLFLVLLARRCDQPHEIKLTSSWKPDKIPAEYKLKPEEKTKVIVDTSNRRVTVVSPDKIQTFEGVRHATIIEKKDGSVEIAAKQYGFCFEPGLGLMASDRVGVSADFQFGFWKAFGANVGARLWPAPTPFLALSFSLVGIHLSDTSLYAGYAFLERNPCVGLRVRL